MKREDLLQKAQSKEVWDVAIIGGGATGLGAALEAASRGLKTILFERRDFASATSSRSTKLVHGGVRYLEQGNVSLVREALHERARLCVNAPHLVRKLNFVVPCYRWWEKPYYRIGLGVYDLLAGRHAKPKSRLLSAQAVWGLLPGIKRDGLRGGVAYWDGQFDDARLAITLARTACKQGAVVLNYAPVMGLQKENGKVIGLNAIDAETQTQISIRATCVINATGIFVDEVRKWEAPNCESMLAYSQGIHLVLPREFLRGETAIIVPKTKDGRVIFIIPWHGQVLVGTTDTAIDAAEYDPQPRESEIEFLLEHAGMYLTQQPQRSDIKSIFVGIRPLVRSSKSAATSKLSRDHTILVENSGLITITGGKWTTYRKMGQDVIETAIRSHRLKANPSITATLKLLGADRNCEDAKMNRGSELEFLPLRLYGDEQPLVESLITERPELGRPLAAGYSYTQAEVVWGIRYEMARTVEDLLYRRTRLGLLDQKASQAAVPVVEELLRTEGISHGV
jgi:glycerol-3-phosphate dehydrogenase